MVTIVECCGIAKSHGMWVTFQSHENQIELKPTCRSAGCLIHRLGTGMKRAAMSPGEHVLTRLNASQVLEDGKRKRVLKHYWTGRRMSNGMPSVTIQANDCASPTPTVRCS